MTNPPRINLYRIGAMAPDAKGVEMALPAGRPSTHTRITGRPGLPTTEGPAALRSAFERLFKAMADGWGRDWEREDIERRARAWEQRQRQ